MILINQGETLLNILDRFQDIEFITLPNHNNAVIGIDLDNEVLVYSVNIIIDNLKEIMPEDEAMEYLDYNIINAHMGNKMPVFIKHEQ